MLELDQIMRQNELTIAVVAALPALAIAGFALTALRAWLTPSPPDPRWEALPARCNARQRSQVQRTCLPVHAQGDMQGRGCASVCAPAAGLWPAVSWPRCLAG